MLRSLPRQALWLALNLAAVNAVGAAPDFDAVVTVEPEVKGSGKVAGLVRNVGQFTVSRVVLRVTHRWHWSEGSYRHRENTVVGRLIYPGDPAGFAAVHIPPTRVPESARYAVDVDVVELSEIRMAPE
ncbi:MAG: hypothetical protein ACU85V_11335 [Gammaproteobacteria bacterium]